MYQYLNMSCIQQVSGEAVANITERGNNGVIKGVANDGTNNKAIDKSTTEDIVKTFHMKISADSTILISDYVGSQSDIIDEFSKNQKSIFPSSKTIKIKPGNYDIDVESEHAISPGIICNHSVFLYDPTFNYTDSQPKVLFNFCVDGGTCMIFLDSITNPKYTDKLDNWLDIDSLCGGDEPTCFMDDDTNEILGVYMTSGYGDGIYTCHCFCDSNNDIHGLYMKFITEEPQTDNSTDNPTDNPTDDTATNLPTYKCDDDSSNCDNCEDCDDCDDCYDCDDCDECKKHDDKYEAKSSDELDGNYDDDDDDDCNNNNPN